MTKSDAGTVILSGTNTYTAGTTITGGALQADSGVGLPTASLLTLNGGVLQSNSATTFSRALGTTSGTFQWAGARRRLFRRRRPL